MTQNMCYELGASGLGNSVLIFLNRVETFRELKADKDMHSIGG